MIFKENLRHRATRALPILVLLAFTFSPPMPAKAKDTPDVHKFDDSIWEIGGAKFHVSYVPSTTRFLGTWEKTDSVFLDLRIALNPLTLKNEFYGEISVKFPKAKEACPKKWKKWTKFTGTLSEDGNLILGSFGLEKIDLKTCKSSSTDDRIKLAFKRVPVKYTNFCDPPSDLGKFIKKLELRWKKHTRNRADLPDEAMFRRTGLSKEEMKDAAYLRSILDQQMQNGGPDDWLLAAGRDGGVIKRIIDEARPFLDSKTHCNKAEWQALAGRLELLARQFHRRKSHMSRFVGAVETNYITWNAGIRDILNTQTERAIPVKIFNEMGISTDDDLTDAGIINLLSVLKSYFALWTKKAASMGTAIADAYKILVAIGDIVNIKRGEGLLPEFFEIAEQYSWLRPLGDWYEDLDGFITVIHKSVDNHVPHIKGDDSQ